MSGLGDLCRSYLDVRWLFDPAQGTRAGNAESDARLPALDAEAVRLQLATLRSLAGATEELSVEDDEEEIDRTALLDELRTTIFRFESEVPHRHNPAAWLASVCQAWQSLLAHPGRAAEARAEAALARLEAAPALLSSAAATLREPAVLFVDEALELVPAARRLPARLAAAAGGWRPDLAERLVGAAAAAESAVAAFGERVRAIAPTADAEAFAVGEEEFDHRLHFEHALHSAAPELWRWAQRQVEELAAQVAAAADRVERGADPLRLAARLRAEHAVGADHQVAFLREVARARKFVDDRGLITAPRGDIRVLETPEFLRPLVPVAAYEAPGVLYLTPLPAPRTRWELAGVALREVCPGRQLHRARAAELPSEVRRFLATPVALDGWAAYATAMMYRAGFAESVEEEFFHQVALLHAAALAVVDIGLHTRGTAPADAVEYLTARVPVDRAEALSDVRRAAAWPTYALAAAVGRRELEQLHDAWRAREGDDAPLKKFHDTVLGYGGLPVSLVRWGMDLGLDE